MFWKCEKNQDWTYFEGIYFAYTTLLTIGYGDFQPESNSGKPFFVFWSLLAIPTLTILISNMGDTVIAVIKDGTIWLGELTVLPSETGSVRESAKIGLVKLTGGKLDVNAIRNTSGVNEEPTSGVHPPKREAEDPAGGKSKGDIEAAEDVTADLAEAEQLDENDARADGNGLAEDIHHYRHMLLDEIRRVYVDVNAAEPKKYTYEEWSHFLELLGEDEGNAKYHRKAPMKPQKSKLSRTKTGDETTAIAAEEEEAEDFKGDSGQKHAKIEEDEPDNDASIKQWSWIGHRSPLMGGKDEPEWILEKLFERLGEELQEERKLAKKMRQQKEAETGERQPTLDWPVRPVESRTVETTEEEESRETRRESGNSSRTLEEQSGESSRSASK